MEVLSFCQNPCMNHLIVIQILSIPPLPVSLPSNTHVCPNYDKDVSLLSEGTDSLEQFFDTQLQNLTQTYPVKSNSKGTNTKREPDILIKSLQETIFILKKELINKETPSKTYL